MSEGTDRRGFLRTGAVGALATAGLVAADLGLADDAGAATVGKPRIPSYYRDSTGKAHSRAYLGVFAARATPGISDPEALEKQVGRRFAINHSFRQPAEAPWGPIRTRMLRDKAAGRIPMLSWAAGEQPGVADHDDAALARLTEIAAGKRDAAIDGQARALKALGTPVFLRFTWEFDLRYPGPVGVRTHKAAWRRVVKRFRALGATNVAFVWCPSWLAYSNGRAAAFYPGDSYVDWIGVDGYARPEYPTFTSLFSGANSFAALKGKPLMVAECGVHRRTIDSSTTTRPTAQSTWLDGLRADLEANRFGAIKALLYFHVDGDNHPLPNQWRVTDPTAGPALAAFKRVAAHPRMKATR